eukprot:scaffold17562_cov23-Tisochrysis_lutea.AAC.2
MSTCGEGSVSTGYYSSGNALSAITINKCMLLRGCECMVQACFNQQLVSSSYEVSHAFQACTLCMSDVCLTFACLTNKKRRLLALRKGLLTCKMAGWFVPCELVTVGDKSSTPSKRARSERVICAMHIVAALAGRAEGGQARLEAALVKDLVSDLQLIIGRHLFVSVSASAVRDAACVFLKHDPRRFRLAADHDLLVGMSVSAVRDAGCAWVWVF